MLLKRLQLDEAQNQERCEPLQGFSHPIPFPRRRQLQQQLQDSHKVDDFKDFGRKADHARANSDDARFLVLNAMTKLTENIRIHENVTAKPMHNWEKVVQQKSEHAFGVPEGSLPSHIGRMLMAQILSSTMQNQVHFQQTHQETFAGMSHSFQTHVIRYLETVAMGNHAPCAKELVERNLILCLTYLKCMGFLGYNFDTSQSDMSPEGYTQRNHPGPNPHSPLVLFDKSATLGLVQLAGTKQATLRATQIDLQ